MFFLFHYFVKVLIITTNHQGLWYFAQSYLDHPFGDPRNNQRYLPWKSPSKSGSNLLIQLYVYHTKQKKGNLKESQVCVYIEDLCPCTDSEDDEDEEKTRNSYHVSQWEAPRGRQDVMFTLYTASQRYTTVSIDSVWGNWKQNWAAGVFEF